MALAGGRAVKEAMDKVQAGENVFFHDIPLIGIEAMKEDIKKAIAIFSQEV
jgi:fructose-bisphosphate aldolase class II